MIQSLKDSNISDDKRRTYRHARRSFRRLRLIGYEKRKTEFLIFYLISSIQVEKQTSENKFTKTESRFSIFDLFICSEVSADGRPRHAADESY